MALSELAVRTAKARSKQFKLYDEKGLLVLVRPTGGKLWRFKYRFAGKEQQLSLGTYPEVGLRAARDRRDEARKLVSAGKNPAVEKRRAAVAAAVSRGNTFALVASELIEKMRREGRANATITKAWWHLSRLQPLANLPIAEIEAFELLAVLRRLEERGNLEAARQVRSFASRVFRYGVATTRCKHDVAADLIGALIAPNVKHHAAIVNPNEVGALLRAIDGFQGEPSTCFALQLAPHVFVRPGELRSAEWQEIDLDAQVWTIPAYKTKMRKPHAVPLSPQAKAILEQARELSGNGKLVFPGQRSAHRPISENTMNAALRRLGYGKNEMTAHGFRTMASTLLNDSGLWRADVIERALAHGERDGTREAYNRAIYWAERENMARWWSDYLDDLRDQSPREARATLLNGTPARSQLHPRSTSRVRRTSAVQNN
jgi:integrase